MQAISIAVMAAAAGFGLVVGAVGGVAFVRVIEQLIDWAMALVAFLWSLRR